MAGIFKRPDYPVFENEPDFFCRALYAVAIGNDYWEGGQKNCGPKTVMDFKIGARDISDTRLKGETSFVIRFLRFLLEVSIAKTL